MFTNQTKPRLATIAMLSLCALAPLSAPAASFAPRVEMTVTSGAALDDTVITRVHAGMTAGEVQALIGAPDRKDRFERTRTTAWSYEYRDLWGYDAEFSVIFDDAEVVVGKVSTRHDG
jgi:outer membrane protein assembly factor BamE (lipoprotein component of BamABCDE complex)